MRSVASRRSASSSISRVVSCKQSAERIRGQIADEARRAARARSGNPAVRSGHRPPREEAVARRIARSGKNAVAETRERIDEGLRDIAGSVVGGISEAWHTVFG